MSAWARAGGYYLGESYVFSKLTVPPMFLFQDVGASQYIIDGKVKLKNDSQIASFTETGLRFENGSELQADVVIFCTGLVIPQLILTP